MKDKSKLRFCTYEARITAEEADLLRQICFKLGLSYSQFLRFSCCYAIKVILNNERIPEDFII